MCPAAGPRPPPSLECCRRPGSPSLAPS
jgi:hypothetical protein